MSHSAIDTSSDEDDDCLVVSVCGRRYLHEEEAADCAGIAYALNLGVDAAFIDQARRPRAAAGSATAGPEESEEDRSERLRKQDEWFAGHLRSVGKTESEVASALAAARSMR